MYNESFDKLIPKENPEYKAEIPAVIDNTTFFINAPAPDGSNHMIPVGDFNAIFDALLNNDAAIKKITDALVARKITAGKGLIGGGALNENLTIDVVSANNGILVNEDNIQLQTVNNLTSTDVNKPLSANMGKKLNDNKFGSNGLLVSFDGTFGDFTKKNSKSGIYTVLPNSIGSLALPQTIYPYGTLLVQYNDDQCKMTYTTDSIKTIDENYIYGELELSIFNLANNPSFKFTTDMWNEIQFKVDKKLNTASKNVVDAINENKDEIDNKVSKSGDTMTGQLIIPPHQGLTSAKNIHEGELYNLTLSAESGYVLLIRYSDNQNKANEFLGIDSKSRALFRKASGNRKSDYHDYELLHNGNFNEFIGVKNLNTNSKEVIGAINERFWHYGGQDLKERYSSATKLSEIKESGLFFTHSIASNFTDFPTNYKGPFILRNMYYNDAPETGTYMIQEYIASNAKGVYIREIYWNGDMGPWRKLMEDIDVYKKLGGTDDVKYIQDAGTKYINKGYIDKDTGKIYTARETNTDTSVTNKFYLATNVENSNKINNIVYGKCKASSNGVGSYGGDILQFNRKILSAVANHYGYDATVSVTLDDRNSTTDFEKGKIRFTANYPQPVDVRYIIILGDPI